MGMGAAPAGGVTIHTREASGTALGVIRPLREELAGTVYGIRLVAPCRSRRDDPTRGAGVETARGGGWLSTR